MSGAPLLLPQAAIQKLEDSLQEAFLITNAQGEILLATSKARLLLKTFFIECADPVLPGELCTWLIEGCDSQKPFVVRDPEKGEVEIQCLSLSRTQHLMLLCIQHRPGPKVLRELGLTSREAEILYWMAEGKHNPEIAIVVNASLNAVKKHASNIFAKLGVESRGSAIRLALEVLMASQATAQQML
jgi:DNA-binding CsgD family transcriptional regulator